MIGTKLFRKIIVFLGFFHHQYTKDYKVEICRGGRSTVDSERVDGQQ